MTAAATLEPVLGLTITGALLPLMPDIIIGTKNHASLEETYATTLHELSHATHYFGLGTNGKEVWIREYYDMLSGWGKMIADGKSPFEDCYNNGGTDLIKLIESWGYFSEGYLMFQKYPNYEYGKKLEDRLLRVKYIDEQEYESDSVKYFYYGGLFDLIDSDNEAGIDFSEGFEYGDIYKAVTTQNVDTLNRFAEELVILTSRNDELENVIKTLESNHD